MDVCLLLEVVGEVALVGFVPLWRFPWSLRGWAGGGCSAWGDTRCPSGSGGFVAVPRRSEEQWGQVKAGSRGAGCGLLAPARA